MSFVIAWMGEQERTVRHPIPSIASAVLLSLIAALLAGITLTSVSAGPQATVRLAPVGSRVDWADGPFTISIEISGLDHHGVAEYDDDRDGTPDRTEPSEGLGAFEVLLHFDPTVLEVTQADGGDFFDRSGRSPQCLQRIPERGQYAVGCVSTGVGAGPQGSGTLATLTLTPLANGMSFLVMEAQLGGPLADTIPVTSEGGVVEVFGAPQDATPEPDDPPDSERPGDQTDGEGSEPTGSGPTVIGGGELGVVTLPDTGPGGAPIAGTGYEPPNATLRPLILGAAFAVAGTALLLFGVRRAARTRRS